MLPQLPLTRELKRKRKTGASGIFAIPTRGLLELKNCQRTFRTSSPILSTGISFEEFIFAKGTLGLHHISTRFSGLNILRWWLPTDQVEWSGVGPTGWVRMSCINCRESILIWPLLHFRQRASAPLPHMCCRLADSSIIEPLLVDLGVRCYFV